MFYMPHHNVQGKKLRVVFDKTFEDVKGRALIDALHMGPSSAEELVRWFQSRLAGATERVAGCG